MRSLLAAMASARFTPVTVSVAVWIPLFASLVVGSHLSLGTNAYDLSVFDYALWNTVQGDPGHVPFFGYSLFAQHFMPSLLALLPAYLLAPSPLTLIWLQIAAIVVAAILLDRLIPTSFPMLGRWALLIAFLFSRRSYSAFSSVFYLESMEPALIFGLLLAWKAKRWLWYWAVLILALGCKEDVALYIASFGIIQIGLGQRRIGLATALFASVWLIFAVGFAIPQARAAEGLPIANPFLVARYSDVQHGETQSIGAVFARVVSARGVGKVVTLTSAVLFCCWAAPTWLAVAALGIVLNLAARPDTLQSGLNGHYLWPILPWLYFAAIQGASRVSGRWPQLVTPFFIVLIAFTLADSPALRRISSLNQQSQ